MKPGKPLYSLVILEQFMVLLGVDDKEDKQARIFLVSPIFTVEYTANGSFCIDICIKDGIILCVG